MQRSSYLLATITIMGCTASDPPDRAADRSTTPLPELRWIDLGHGFSDRTIYWPNNPTGFELDAEYNGITPAGFYYSSNKLCAPEHGGTHMDAPVHFAEGKHSADEVPLDQLIGTAVVLDVSAAVGEDADHLVSVAEVEAWETANGRIPDGAIILIRTGWDRYYDDRAKCLGTSLTGEAAIPHLHFPGIAPELSTWIVEHRKTKAVGMDTPSLDHGQSTDFMTHRILSAQNICGFENLANLDRLPPHGAFVVALPMKIDGGSGAPLRIVAGVAGN